MNRSLFLFVFACSVLVGYGAKELIRNIKKYKKIIQTVTDTDYQPTIIVWHPGNNKQNFYVTDCKVWGQMTEIEGSFSHYTNVTSYNGNTDFSHVFFTRCQFDSCAWIALKSNTSTGATNNINYLNS